MSDLPPSFVLLLLLCLGLIAALWWQHGRGGRRARARARRAAKGEADAVKLLESHGYVVVDSQVPGAVKVEVDGEPLRFDLRADYLVERGGRSWVAEVKTGELAPRLSHGATRRQLMEYAQVFQADGVLLVTPEEGRVREVVFERDPAPALQGDLRWFMLGILVGGAGVALWLG